ncbi:MAG: hypothetical protein KG029_07800 [Bacteroidetes bacterium]|nr:hypothetical protein [Bacteroidota bacterium]
MYRIAVTTLEKFRRMVDNVSDWDTEQSLIESLTGKFTGNDKTRLGNAFHKIIELPFTLNGSLTVEGITFTPEQAQPAIDYRNAHPHMIHEVPAKKIYHTKHMEFTVSGRADGVEGLEIRDAKCKFSYPGWGEYYTSYQWRFYLDMFEAHTFWYDVFEVRGYKGTDPSGRFEGQIVPHEPFPCMRYEMLANDVQNLAEEFAHFMTIKNYTNLLTKIA